MEKFVEKMRVATGSNNIPLALQLIRENMGVFDNSNKDFKKVIKAVEINPAIIYIAYLHGYTDILKLCEEKEIGVGIGKIMKIYPNEWLSIKEIPEVKRMLLKYIDVMEVSLMSLRYKIGDGNWEYTTSGLENANFETSLIEYLVKLGAYDEAKSIIRSYRIPVRRVAMKIISDIKKILPENDVILKDIVNLINQRVELDKVLYLIEGKPIFNPIEEISKYGKISTYITNAVDFSTLLDLGNSLYSVNDLPYLIDNAAKDDLIKFTKRYDPHKAMGISSVEYINDVVDKVLDNLPISEIPGEFIQNSFNLEVVNIGGKYVCGLSHSVISKMYRMGVDLKWFPERLVKVIELSKTFDVEELKKYMILGGYVPQNHTSSEIPQIFTDAEMIFFRTFTLDPNECISDVKVPGFDEVKTLSQIDYSYELPEKYTDILEWYIYEDYSVFNQDVNSDSLGSEYFAIYKDFSELIENSPRVNKDVILYRGINATGPYSSEYEYNGKTYTLWKSVSSCSQFREVSDRFAGRECCMFVIECLKGCIAFDIKFFKQTEPEVLLPFNTILEFLYETVDERGRRNIHMKYVGYIKTNGIVVMYDDPNKLNEDILFRTYPLYITNPSYAFTAATPFKGKIHTSSSLRGLSVHSKEFFFNKKFPEIGKGDVYERIKFLQDYPDNPEVTVEELYILSSLLTEIVKSKFPVTQESLTHTYLDETKEEYFQRFKIRKTNYLMSLYCLTKITRDSDITYNLGGKDIVIEVREKVYLYKQNGPVNVKELIEIAQEIAQGNVEEISIREEGDSNIHISVKVAE